MSAWVISEQTSRAKIGLCPLWPKSGQPRRSDCLPYVISDLLFFRLGTDAGLRLNEMGVAVRIVSYSVTTTTPGTGSSITSMIVSSTGTSTAWLGVLLGAFLAAIFDCRCFFAAPLTLDFACFGVMRFAAFLRACLALALPPRLPVHSVRCAGDMVPRLPRPWPRPLPLRPRPWCQSCSEDT